MGTSYAFNEAKMLEGIQAYREEIRSIPAKVAPVLLKPTNSRQLLLKTAEKFAVTPDLILSNRRDSHLVNARQVIVFVLRRQHGWSLTRIGHMLNRHHTTVLHAETQAAEHYENLPTFREAVDELMRIRIDIC
jgi:chromosomal replication initiation ATPase DnaA